LEGDEIGLVLRTRARTKPVYVSIGHRVNLEEAKRLVLRVTGRYRIPEPLRLAHQLVTRLRAEREERARKTNEGNGR
jgi:deoxyribonuclease V